MKIRVEGDGTPTGTRVFTESGEDITACITAVNFRHDAGKPPAVEIDFHMPVVGFAGEGKAFFNGRQVSRIVYADGGEEEF